MAYHIRVLVVFAFLVIQESTYSQSIKTSNTAVEFIEIRNFLPEPQTNLRKWDSPVIADLDQDGYDDLLLNDHGLGVKVVWNNKGVFTPPYDIIMGDLHGITVGDFDKDGLLEVIMSRGGGSGSNARNSKIFRVDKSRNFNSLPDFEVPLELMRGRTVKLIDANNDGHLDLLDFAFPDKDKKGESENYIYKNDGNGQLVLSSTLPPSKVNGQKTLITDFNNDNIGDLVIYGEGIVKVYQGKGDMSYKDVSQKVLPTDIKEVTSVVEIDFDNDGDFDLFFTRGNEFEIGETFFDPENVRWGFFTKRGKFDFELEVGDVLNIENFQSQWPDNDAFYIGETGYEYEFPGETHSGKDMRLINSDCLGFPDEMKKRGIHIGYIGNRKWRIAGHLWAPATGVVKGVEYYSKSNHPKGPHDILLENRNGKFKEKTNEIGLYQSEHTVASTVTDFDNNGFQDLLIIKRGDLIHQNSSLLYLNQGERGFILQNEHHIVTAELGAIGMAVDNIDYDQDGLVDVVIGNERGKWHLFKNATPTSRNHSYLTVEIGKSPDQNASPLGALVSIESCNNDQLQRVGFTGAAYSLSLKKKIHFGIGNCRGPINVKVVWPTGETQKIITHDINKPVFLGNR